MAIPIVFDSDGGVDDAAALWYACTSPGLELVAVTTVAGNVSSTSAAENLATVLAAAGRSEVPIAVGLGAAIGPHPPLVAPTALHGMDGLGDCGIERVAYRAADESAPELLARLAAERPDELTIVTAGPLSNLAATIRSTDGWSRRIARLVIMGGSARRGGNARPAAEANIAHDPLAASEVVAAQWSRPPLMIGLDATLTATFTEAEFALVREQKTPAARFLSGPLAYYRTAGSSLAADGECPCHDLLAMMAAEDEAIVNDELLPVAVDLGGHAAWGATVVDFRAGIWERRGLPIPEPDRPRIRVALDADASLFRHRARQLFTHKNA